MLTRDGVTVTDFERQFRYSRAVQRITWDPIAAEKGGFKHYMLKEIYEQPRAVRDTIIGRVSQTTGRVYLDEMEISEAEFRQFHVDQSDRLRHQPARGDGRQVHARRAGADSGRSRLRVRVSLSRSDHSTTRH